ncbi:hypothetical protein DMENIID0001_001470 [Sergentomyia squamirostris]
MPKAKKKIPTVKPYGKENLKSALEAVRNGSTIRQASQTFRVPKSIIQTKLSGEGLILDHLLCLQDGDIENLFQAHRLGPKARLQRIIGILKDKLNLANTKPYTAGKWCSR